MSMRVRLGPVSVSSRGRVGANVGPFSVYGGGGGGGFFGPMIAVALVLGAVFVAVMWPLSLVGHAAGLTPSWHQLMNRDHAWMHEHYPLVGLRYGVVLVVVAVALAVASVPILRALREHAAEQQRLADLEYQQWLDGPPPPLAVPSRFTQRWIEENVPSLHPGQVPVLLGEMRARGWTDVRIQERVGPYLPG